MYKYVPPQNLFWQPPHHCICAFFIQQDVVPSVTAKHLANRTCRLHVHATLAAYPWNSYIHIYCRDVCYSICCVCSMCAEGCNMLQRTWVWGMTIMLMHLALTQILLSQTSPYWIPLADDPSLIPPAVFSDDPSASSSESSSVYERLSSESSFNGTR